LEFGVQPVGMVALGIGGVLVKPSGLADALAQIFREVADAAASFLGATQDSLDMNLGTEADDVRWLGQFSQACSQVGNGVLVSGSAKVFARGSQTGSRSPL
jgi:hypothetical protein